MFIVAHQVQDQRILNFYQHFALFMVYKFSTFSTTQVEKVENLWTLNFHITPPVFFSSTQGALSSWVYRTFTLSNLFLNRILDRRIYTRIYIHTYI